MPELPEFDPNAHYKALRNFRFAGRAVVKDGHIDPAKLSDEERDRKMRLLYENRHIGPMSDEEAEALGLPIGDEPLTEAQTARVSELMSKSREDLNDLADAAGIDDADKLPNKEAVATAIARREAAEADAG